MTLLGPGAKLQAGLNLSDVESAATCRTNLGVPATTAVTTSVTAGADLVVTGGDGFGHGDITVALSEDTAWTPASLGNSWTNTQGTARFIKIGKIVFINGFIGGGSLQTTAFTLPVGYRPSQNQRFPTVANNAFGFLFITPAGAVQPFIGATTNVEIDCCFTVV